MKRGSNVAFFESRFYNYFWPRGILLEGGWTSLTQRRRVAKKDSRLVGVLLKSDRNCAPSLE